jgi:hypothetical protein
VHRVTLFAILFEFLGWVRFCKFKGLELLLNIWTRIFKIKS